MENFVFAELYVAFDKAALDDAERYFIAELRPVYNATRGGSGSPGPKAEATKQKLAAHFKRLAADPDWVAKRTLAVRRAAAEGKFTACGQRLAASGAGLKARWAGHVKRVNLTPEERREAYLAAWRDPEIRARRIAGQKKALARPEVKARKRELMLGRVMPRESVKKTAAAKFKPVFCPELGVTFESQKYAAEVLGVKAGTLAYAVAKGTKVNGNYSFVGVS